MNWAATGWSSAQPVAVFPFHWSRLLAPEPVGFDPPCQLAEVLVGLPKFGLLTQPRVWELANGMAWIRNTDRTTKMGWPLKWGKLVAFLLQ